MGGEGGRAGPPLGSPPGGHMHEGGMKGTLLAWLGKDGGYANLSPGVQLWVSKVSLVHRRNSAIIAGPGLATWM